MQKGSGPPLFYDVCKYWALLNVKCAVCSIEYPSDQP